MDRKLLLLASLLMVFMIPAALSAAEPAGPSQLHQAAPAATGCAAGQDLVTQIFGKQPAAPAVPVSPFAARQEKTWCGACLDFDCSTVCPCGGEVTACAPGCRPICFCISC